MNPNWSKLEAIGRTLVILFASTFCGALVLPLASDGHLPVDWAHWKPVLATGASAAIVAEFVWIRSHLAAAAAAIGLPAPGAAVADAAKTAVKLAGTALGTLLLIATLGACSPSSAPTPQTVTDVNAGVTLAVCVFDTYAADEQAGMAPAQVALDVAQKCGTDAATVAVLLAAEKRSSAADQVAAAKAVR